MAKALHRMRRNVPKEYTYEIHRNMQNSKCPVRRPFLSDPRPIGPAQDARTALERALSPPQNTPQPPKFMPNFSNSNIPLDISWNSY